MNDEIKQRWESLENDIKVAMTRLSEAIEKAKDEMPAAGRAINEEYLRVQEMLDRAVAKLRK